MLYLEANSRMYRRIVSFKIFENHLLLYVTYVVQKLVNQVELVDEVHSNYSDFFESILKTHFLPNLTGQPSLMMLNASYLLSQLVWVVLVLLILHNILIFSFLCQLPLLLHWFS